MTNQMSKMVTYYLFLTMIVSSFVSFEPAPYDLLMIAFIAFGILFSFYKITKDIAFPLVVMCVFLVSNLISLFFVNEMSESLLFTGITFYLVLTWGALVALGQQAKDLNLQLIINGYIISATLAAIMGTLAYFHVLPFNNELLMYGRVTSFFKDPNVFGPFLVMPALFAISMTEKKGIIYLRKVIYFSSFLLLVMGIILSFSRAAWGNFVISIVLYFIIFKKEVIRERIKTFLLLFFIGVPMILYFIQTPMVGGFFEDRLGYQGYDNTRFNTQKEVFTTGLSNPLGVGGGQSDNVAQRSPHNLYARVFTENGILGVLSLLLLFLLSIIRAYKSYSYTKNENSSLYLIIFASLIGLAFNSFFIDTLHWRNLWLLLALAWFPGHNSKEKYVKVK